MRRGAVQLLLAVVGTGLGSGTARAHSLGSTRVVLPVPLAVIAVGAGLVVIGGAGVLGWRGVRARKAPGRELARLPRSALRAGRVSLRLGVLGLTAGTVGLGLLGGPAPGNPAPQLGWVVGLHGFALVAILLGDHWRTLSPWRSGYAFLCWLEGDLLVSRPYPPWLVAWPAVVIVGIGGVVVTATSIPRSPRLTALSVTVYAGVMLAGALVFGPEWLDRADGLAVVYRLLGRVAPVTVRTEAGRSVLVGRAPWHVDKPVVDSPTAGVVGIAYAAVLLDGLADAGVLPTGQLAIPLVVVGLLGGGGLVWAGGAGIDRLLASDTAGGGAGAVATAMVPGLAATELARTYGPVLETVGTITGIGDLLWWLTLPTFWSSQVLVVIGGHLVAMAIILDSQGGRRYPVWLRRVLVGVVACSAAVATWVVSRPLVV